jgi:hypothetical protein
MSGKVMCCLLIIQVPVKDRFFLQYGWSGTYHDHGGLDGSGTVEITIDSDLLSALRSSDGAQVYGKL